MVNTWNIAYGHAYARKARVVNVHRLRASRLQLTPPHCCTAADTQRTNFTSRIAPRCENDGESTFRCVDTAASPTSGPVPRFPRPLPLRLPSEARIRAASSSAKKGWRSALFVSCIFLKVVSHECEDIFQLAAQPWHHADCSSLLRCTMTPGRWRGGRQARGRKGETEGQREEARCKVPFLQPALFLIF
jgi:hypothetical protein